MYPQSGLVNMGRWELKVKNRKEVNKCVNGMDSSESDRPDGGGVTKVSKVDNDMQHNNVVS